METETITCSKFSIELKKSSELGPIPKASNNQEEQNNGHLASGSDRYGIIARDKKLQQRQPRLSALHQHRLITKQNKKTASLIYVSFNWSRTIGSPSLYRLRTVFSTY